MKRQIGSFISLAFAALLAGCGQADRIDASGAVYNEIAPETAITLAGTEPFWSLEIDAALTGKHTARFTQMGDTVASVFQVTRFAGNNGLGFSGELNGKAVQIAVTPTDCSDGMSDRSYPFAATLMMGDATLFGCAYTDEAPFSGQLGP